MPIVSSHAKGAPCWFELGTSDQKAAGEFYKSLFGWEVVDVPIGEGMVYSMYKLAGNDVCAGYTLMPSMVKAGVPPYWGVYFSTDSADATATRAAELGGSVEQGAFDVFEHGRMAVLKDPEGAVFCLWQPKGHIGAKAFGEMNTVCWAELATRDAERAMRFYSDLFGWSTKDSTGQPTRYIEFTPAGDTMPAGGLLQMNEQWEGIQMKQLGGKICHGPFDAPGVGRIAVCSDPQGALFSVIELRM
jgi:uncharacterized protein